MKKPSSRRSKSSGSSYSFWSHLSSVVSNSPSQEVWRRTFFVLAALLFFLFVGAAFQTGINGDEDVQVPYGVKALDFYTSFGADTAVLKSKKGDAIRYYGGGFEVPVTLISKAVGFDIASRNYFHLRHLLLALLGWLAMLAAGGTARQLGNWRMAVLAIILVGFAPRFFGHSMMNPKDIPFAAGYMFSIYFMFCIFKHFHLPRLKDLIGLAVALGFSLSVRVGALLLFIYFIAFLLSYLFILKQAKKSIPSAKQLSMVAGIPILGGFALGVLFWPYGLLSPISHTIESLTTFSDFPVSINVLFKGSMVWSNDIPFEYLFVWIAYTVPLAFLAGLLFLVFSLWNSVKSGPLFLLLSSLFVVLFPLFYVVYKDSPLYDGWRHFNFVYVAAAPLAALGWDNLIKFFKNRGKFAQWIPIGAFILLSLEPAWHIVKNIATPYVYFNTIAGDTEGAFGEFEMDYWGISTRKAVEKMEEAGIFYPGMDEVTIGVNFSYGVRHWLHPDYADKVKLTYVRYRERYQSSDWDYSIFVGRFMDGAHMKAIDWPGSVRVIETVEVDGVPVCAIFEKGANYAYQGINAARRRNWDQAISLLQQELEYDPVNELASFHLAESYAGKGQIDRAIDQYEKTLELNPHSQQVIMKTALAYMNQAKWIEAERHLESHSQRNPRDYASLYYLALIHARTSRLPSAAEYIEQSIKINPNFKEAYQLGAQIYEAMGNSSKASYYKSLAN